MLHFFLGASFRKYFDRLNNQAEGRAAPGYASLRFFPAQGTGAGKELNPLHPVAQKNWYHTYFDVLVFACRRSFSEDTSG